MQLSDLLVFPKPILLNIYIYYALKHPSEEDLLILLQTSKACFMKVLQSNSNEFRDFLPSIVAKLRLNPTASALSTFERILAFPALVDWTVDQLDSTTKYIPRSQISEWISFSDLQKYDLEPDETFYLESERSLIRFTLKNSKKWLTPSSTSSSTTPTNAYELFFDTGKDLVTGSFHLSCRRGFQKEVEFIYSNPKMRPLLTEEDLSQAFLNLGRQGHTLLFQSLLKLTTTSWGKDTVTFQSEWVFHAFEMACEKGQNEFVEAILKAEKKNEAPIVLSEPIIRKGMISAIRAAQPSIVALLLEHPSMREDTLPACTKVAATVGNLEVLKILTRKSEFNSGVGKALQEAAASGQMQVLEYILDQTNLSDQITDTELMNSIKLSSGDKVENKMKKVLVSRASTRRKQPILRLDTSESFTFE